MEGIIQLLWSSVLAYAIIQGILLLLVFPTFRQGSFQAKWLLASLSLLSALVLTEEFVETMIGYDQFPHLIFVFSPFWYALGPLLFFYIRLSIRGKAIRWIEAWHFLPVIIVALSSMDFYLFSADAKLQYLTHIEQGDVHPIHNFNYVIFSLQCCTYLVLSGLMLQRKSTKANKDVEYRWLYFLVLTLTVLFIQSLLTLFVFNHPEITDRTNSLYYLSLTFFLIVLFIRSVRSPKTLYLIGRPPGFKAPKLDTSAEFQRIQELMTKDKPYADPSYDIQNLANALGFSKHFINQLIKEHTQLSFRDFINRFRVEEVKRRLSSPESKQYTIEFIAIESGFHSQATFYRVFKKMEGRTPRSFMAG